MYKSSIFQKLIFWLHVVLIVIAYFSFLYVDWIIILIVAVLLQIQYHIFNGCILTFLQMGRGSEDTFLWYYLFANQKLVTKQTINFTIRNILPVIIIIFAIIAQEWFGLIPYISL